MELRSYMLQHKRIEDSFRKNLLVMLPLFVDLYYSRSYFLYPMSIELGTLLEHTSILESAQSNTQNST